MRQYPACCATGGDPAGKADEATADRPVDCSSLGSRRFGLANHTALQHFALDAIFVESQNDLWCEHIQPHDPIRPCAARWAVNSSRSTSRTLHPSSTGDTPKA
jgi:hypothetical protein